MRLLFSLVKAIASDNNKSNPEADKIIEGKLASKESFDEKFLFNLYDLDINAKDKDGNTTLHICATVGSEGIVKRLIKAGADLNIRDQNGDTALICAAKNKSNYNLVKVLIKAGSEFKNIAIDEEPLFIWAIKNGYLSIIKALIKAGAEFKTTAINGEPLFTWAARREYYNLVEVLINDGAECKNITINEEPLLIWSAKKEYDNVIVALIESGMEFKDVIIDDVSLLTYAGRNNKEGIALAILKRIDKSSIEARNFIEIYLTDPRNNIFSAKLNADERHTNLLYLNLSQLLEYVEEDKRAEIVQYTNDDRFKKLFKLSQETGIKFSNVVNISNIVLYKFIDQEFINKNKIIILELEKNNTNHIKYKDVKSFSKMSMVAKEFKHSILPDDMVNLLMNHDHGYKGASFAESIKKSRGDFKAHGK